MTPPRMRQAARPFRVNIADRVRGFGSVAQPDAFALDRARASEGETLVAELALPCRICALVISTAARTACATCLGGAL